MSYKNELKLQELLRELDQCKLILYTPVDDKGRSLDNEAEEMAFVPVKLIENIKRVLKEQ